MLIEVTSFMNSYSKMKKRKPFTEEFSRRKRRKMVMRLKKRIKDSKEEFGGKFWSDVYFNSIDKSENKKTTRHWIDIFFPSKKDPSILWNAEILTAAEILNDNYNFGKRNKEIDIFNIHEEFSIHKDYRYGIGLTIIVNEADLTQEIIEKIIERFYAMGEVSWKSTEVVDKESLINIYENDYKEKAEGGALLIID